MCMCISVGEWISLARSLALFPDPPRSMTWMVLSIESSSSNHGSRDGDNAFQWLAGRAAFFNISAHIIYTSLQTRASYFEIIAHCLQRERERQSQPTRTGKDTSLYNTNIPSTSHSEFVHNALEFAWNKWNWALLSFWIYSANVVKTYMKIWMYSSKTSAVIDIWILVCPLVHLRTAIQQYTYRIFDFALWLRNHRAAQAISHEKRATVWCGTKSSGLVGDGEVDGKKKGKQKEKNLSSVQFLLSASAFFLFCCK
jgi:hypothetical protein